MTTTKILTNRILQITLPPVTSGLRGVSKETFCPPEQVDDPEIVMWALKTGPWMNERQRITLLTLCRFFSKDMIWLVITQDALAQAVGWSRRTVIKRLKELAELDLITIEAVYRDNLQVANAYSLAGSRTGWQPTPMTEKSADPLLAHKNRIIADYREYTAALEAELGAGPSRSPARRCAKPSWGRGRRIYKCI